jgi:uncharacterized cupin superfamily protein
VSEPVNVFAVTTEGGPDSPPGYRSRIAPLRERLGGTRIGGTVWELDPGESTCPYHYENTEEEWLYVLTGTPTLRDPDGEHELVPGDVVAFLKGPQGGHKVTNRSAGVVRILMVSTIPETLNSETGDPITICVYPDSDKVGVWPPGGRYRMSEGLGYWDGEI